MEPTIPVSELNKFQSYQVSEYENIYPMCENGDILDCEVNKSNESLNENCKGILMFTNETSSCSCQESNGQERNSKNIVRQGWAKYIR